MVSAGLSRSDAGAGAAVGAVLVAADAPRLFASIFSLASAVFGIASCMAAPRAKPTRSRGGGKSRFCETRGRPWDGRSSRAVMLYDPEKLPQVERLLEMLEVERGGALVRIPVSRDDHDRDARQLGVAQLLFAEAAAVHDRHHQVEHDQARPVGGSAELVQGVPAVVRLD